MADETHDPVRVIATATATAPSAMGLTGIAALVANLSMTTLVAILYVHNVTVTQPREHEIAGEQREMDRAAHTKEVKRLMDRADEREERIKTREDERMKRLWERQAALSSAVADIAAELKWYNAKPLGKDK